MDSTPDSILSTWARGATADSRLIEEQYDILAGTYDQTLAEWEYDAPQVAARLLRGWAPADSKVLDAGCGTGLTGTALRQHGFENIVGVDISSASLEMARAKRVYRDVHKADLSRPLPFRDDGFDAVECIGVLTYIDSPDLLREFCRVVRPEGWIVFSFREDIFRQRSYDRVLRDLEALGRWREHHVTEPLPYLPKNEAYATEIRVQYFAYQVCCFGR